MEQVTLTHGLALSNLPVFIAQEYGLYEQFGVQVTLLRPQQVSDLTDALRSGTAQMASMAFTSLMPFYDDDRSLKIVGGAGVLGLLVLGQPDVAWDALREIRAATLRMDVLEILLYEYLRAQSVPYDDIKVQYCTTPQGLTQAFADRAVDLVTHIEPYASRLRRQYGANLLTDGTDLWGPRYPDCVIAARTELLERRPDIVKGVLRALLHAQAVIEADLERACRSVAGTYYQASTEELLEAAPSMPPGVDIRDQADVILGRGPAMTALGYIHTPPDGNFLDFTLLEEVIDEECDVWEQLHIRAGRATVSAAPERDRREGDSDRIER